MDILKRKEVILLLRLVIGVTFVYASFDKVLDPHAFAIAVRRYQIIPLTFSNLFALALAWSEFIAGILLIAGLFTRQAAGALFLLLGMFVVALAIVTVRGMVIDCGCFGSEGGAQTGPLLIVRNLLMMTACAVIVQYDRGALSLGGLIPRRG
jgi:putative oxidoreductase